MGDFEWAAYLWRLPYHRVLDLMHIRILRRGLESRTPAEERERDRARKQNVAALKKLRSLTPIV